MRKKVPWKSRGKKREKGWVWVTKRKEGGQEGEELGKGRRRVGGREKRKR